MIALVWSCLMMAVLVLPAVQGEFQFIYLGCYRDSSELRALPDGISMEEPDALHCGVLAYSQGYSLFGLQYGGECWAGYDYDRATMYGEEPDGCAMPCPGNITQKCGATWQTVLYSLPVPARPPSHPNPPPSPPQPSGQPWIPYQGMGCFAKGDGPHTWTVLSRNASDIQSCAFAAMSRGYFYFGLVHGSDCVAGSSYMETIRYERSNACDVQCSRNVNQMCGGAHAISWYALNRAAYVACNEDSQSLRLLADLLHQSSSMNVSLCAAYAASYAFYGVQGTDCYGLNDSPVLTSLKYSTCTTPCPGDPNQLCGRVNKAPAISFYRIIQPELPQAFQAPSFTYLGCYNDRVDRALSTVLYSPSVQMLAYCAATASAKGFKFFGVEDGGECHAGDDYARAISHGPNSGCMTPCRGEVGDICGGIWKLSIYILPTFIFIGCFKDSVAERALPHLLHTSPTMKASVCGAYASSKGHEYFGLQGEECWSGSDFDVATSYGTSVGCNITCLRSTTTDNCGGYLANAIYQVATPSVPDAAPPPPRFSYAGCVSVDQNVSLPVNLTGSVGSGNFPSSCAAAAFKQGYKVFAVAHGSQCLAGMTDEHAIKTGVLSSPHSLSETLHACNQTCHGIELILENDVCAPNKSQMGLFTLPSSVYMGCYKDLPANRSLPKKLADSAVMTVDVCHAHASFNGYTYFGVQGTGCWAGYVYSEIVRYGAQKSCKTPCPGKSTAKCGGPSAISLYTSIQGTVDSLFTYVGCFGSGKGQALPYKMAVLDVTPDSCAAHALGLGYMYFGVEAGQRCLAGNDYARATRFGSRQGCSATCRGSTRACGGSNRISLYALPKYYFLGCFSGVENDGSDIRAFTYLQDSPDMTIQSCAALAIARGFGVFGIYKGQFCKGTSILQASIMSEEKFLCSHACLGNTTAACDRLSLYQLVG